MVLNDAYLDSVSLSLNLLNLSNKIQLLGSKEFPCLVDENTSKNIETSSKLVIGYICSEPNIEFTYYDKNNEFIILTGASTSNELSKYNQIFRILPSEFQYHRIFRTVLEKHIINYSNTDLIILRDNNKISNSVIEEIFGKAQINNYSDFKYKDDENVLFINLIQDSVYEVELENMIPYSKKMSFKKNFKPVILKGLVKNIKDYFSLNHEVFLIDFVDYENKGLIEFSKLIKNKTLIYNTPEISITYDFYNILNNLHLTNNSAKNIRNELISTEFESSSGKLRFEENGDVVRDFHLYLIKDKEITKVQNLGPYNKIVILI